MPLRYFFVEKDGKLTDDIKSTKDIVLFIQNSQMSSNERISDFARSLIEIKAIRAQTKAINRNSESSDKLSKIGHGLTAAIIFLSLVELGFFKLLFTYFK